MHKSTYNFGVTPPISTNFPVDAEIEATKSLVETLKTMGQYESEEEAQKRYFRLIYRLYRLIEGSCY
jgi:poly(A) polymerase Pap1